MTSNSLFNSSTTDEFSKINTLQYVQNNDPNIGYQISIPQSYSNMYSNNILTANGQLQIDVTHPPYLPDDDFKKEKHRRSKYDKDSLRFACHCGKLFISQPGLNYHIKTKHPELMIGQSKRGRGRPRKYPQLENQFETIRYDNFFHSPKRKNETGVQLNIKDIVEKVFDNIYKGKYTDKLFSHPENYTENFILDNLVKNTKLPMKQKLETNCNEAFYEYLSAFKNKCNEKYFTLLLKFILLFRECYDVHSNKDVPDDKKIACTDKLTPEQIPELCNEFYGEFLDQNDFFGIEDEDDRNEIIEIIQHFCVWLFKNDYTKSKLSLAS
jgi:hypothetical protein